MKRCSKCLIEKEPSEFNKHRSAPDGLQWTCKDCMRSYLRVHYWNNREEMVGKQREIWDKNKHDASYLKRRAGYQKKYRTEKPEIYRARKSVEVALRNGKIQKGPCEKCGTTENVQAHHDDYSKPLHVRWLCAAHHRERHRSFVKVA